MKKKMNLANMPGKLSRNEMKNIYAGGNAPVGSYCCSSTRACPQGTCDMKKDCPYNNSEGKCV